MRVQLFCAAFPPFGKGGGPATSELIARALTMAGHEVEVVTATDGPYEDHSRGYRVTSIGSPNIYANYWVPRPGWQKMIWHTLENFNPVAYVRARKAIRAFKPDLLATISIENVNVATWLAARKAGVPIVHFLHSYFLNCWRGSLYHKGKSCETRCTSCKLLSVGKRASAVQVDAVVGEARYIIDRHVRDGLFGDAKHYVIPSPMTDDPAPVAPAPKTLAEGQPVRIGYIGNLSVEKGVFTLAKVARRLREAYGERVRFVIAGTGREDVTEELKQAMPGDATTFLGWCKPHDFYSQVDIVVVPSQWNEPFGRVSIEPLEYALPVIVARSGGLPENVDDGVSGRIFTPGDADALTGILAGLIDDPAEYARLSRGAAERAPLYFFPAFIATLDGMVREMGQLGPAREGEREVAAERA